MFALHQGRWDRRQGRGDNVVLNVKQNQEVTLKGEKDMGEELAFCVVPSCYGTGVVNIQRKAYVVTGECGEGSMGC